MSKIEDLEKLKEKAEEIRQQRDRAQGRLEETEKRLREEFQVNSIDEAEELLEKLEKEEKQAETEFEKALEEFNEKWGDQLNG